MLEKLHLEQFAEQLNSTFTVKRGSGDAVEMQLIEAQDLGLTPGYEQYSLLFRGPLSHFLEQSIYHFAHESLGEFDVFIVPVKRNQDSFEYQAIINRPI